LAVAALSLLTILFCSGCLVVGATVAAVGAVTVTTVKTAGKVTVATVGATGRVASAAISSSGEMTALTVETAAKLARAGAVVVVDAGSGVVTELPWRQGMQLYAATSAGPGGVSFNTARIFRDGWAVAADLRQARAAEQALRPGDVIELRR
jgi:seryl-tRNA(Sec) selenium transferase